jgi:hypothetical protein
MTVSIMLFIPISSFSSESTSRGIENLIFHEMVESMWWKEQREESGDQRWFETRGLGEVVNSIAVRFILDIRGVPNGKNNFGVRVCFYKLLLENCTRDVSYSLSVRQHIILEDQCPH